MKRQLFRSAVLAAVVTVLLCVTAFAADDLQPGFYTGTVTSELTITPTSGTGATVNQKSVQIDGKTYTYYENADKMNVTVKNTISGGQYLVMLVQGEFDTVPTAANKILFVDQTAATGTTVNFNVYPMTPKAGPVTLLVTNNKGQAMVKQVLNYSAGSLVLGDVNEDGEVQADDAQLLLQYIVELRSLTDKQIKAGDVMKDGEIKANDAQKILNYVVSNIDSLN